MAKKDFLNRMKDREQAVLDIGEEMGIQKMWDYLQIALRDERVVRKKRQGPKPSISKCILIIYFHSALRIAETAY